MASQPMMMSDSELSPEQVPPPRAEEDIAVKIEGVSVAFRSYKERPTTLKEALIKFVRTGQFRYYSNFYALKNVSFSVQRGQVLGIIGSNGAGKSTLLRTIAGVLPPTEGTVTVNGSLDSLIQLGAGFDSELNAIENIYLNSSLRRRSRAQIKARIPHILEFAELEEFATTPIKYYSSGMYARLGFAVAIERDPDILIVDEVLAVGDERFQEKCRAVFQRFLDQKKTIIIVSHGMTSLEKLADTIVLLSKGQVVYVGDPKTAIEKYRDADYQTALGHA
ncbi:MAG: ABC transporter ATP-binding protein [Bdellovibrionales bacterium]|nr:ABC transporter ATP-binding protein [Bdellovibrionales bacterium]